MGVRAAFGNSGCGVGAVDGAQGRQEAVSRQLRGTKGAGAIGMDSRTWQSQGWEGPKGQGSLLGSPRRLQLSPSGAGVALGARLPELGTAHAGELLCSACRVQSSCNLADLVSAQRPVEVNFVLHVILVR